MPKYLCILLSYQDNAGQSVTCILLNIWSDNKTKPEL